MQKKNYNLFLLWFFRDDITPEQDILLFNNLKKSNFWGFYKILENKKNERIKFLLKNKIIHSILKTYFKKKIK